MTANLKLYLGRKVLDCLKKSQSNLTASQLKSLMVVESTKVGNNKLEISIPLGPLESKFGIRSVNQLLNVKPDDIIQNIHCIQDRANRKLCFQINQNIFTKEILQPTTKNEEPRVQRKIVVEFSSPNIAKPFHVGHLRSTIIGNFIANLNEYLNNKVTRINYLGDWGTQFGLIKVGVDKLNFTEDDIKENPLKVLYRSYVHANQLAATNPNILEQAKLEFSKLEQGYETDLASWKNYIQYTINELTMMYDRLGVRFDEYNYESMYSSKHVKGVVDAMNKKKILVTLPDGRLAAKINDRSVSLVKSDGSTLYLTRDVAAAIDRYKKYEFDKMFYVVDNSQSDHFNALKGILNQLDLPWVDRIRHIKFGRIQGMSTRKGTAVFLKDILDETRDLMREKQASSPTTKVPLSNQKVTDILGVSCVIINDLKQRRQKDYEFDWNKALQLHGDSGAKLQYTHCRLYSLEQNSGGVAATECIPELLTEPEVIQLVRQMARFHDVLLSAEEQVEACILVTYLFQLCHNISKAFKTIQVKDQDPVLAGQRLLLFNKSRGILNQGMQILGLKPLNEM